jgi:UDP-N-acetylglucosamine transferase subunit ALG13
MTGRVLFVASTGGHLEQLYLLHRSLLGPGESAVWVTFDSPQSRSLLAAEAEAHYIGRVGSRGYRDLARSLAPALRILRKTKPVRVYSTGAGVALAFLPFAWLAGARATYIESAARTHGPSFTGRLLSLLPWIAVRTQYASWAGPRWRYARSVFDGYQPVPAQAAAPVRRVLVTLGTQEGYPFLRLVRRLRQIIPEGVDVHWQLGPDFPVDERPPGAHEMISRNELTELIASSDAVVTHAGVGSALTLLAAGRTPVLVPRSARCGEHIDDHQQLIADELSSRGLAVSVAPTELTWEHVVRASRTTVQRAS